MKKPLGIAERLAPFGTTIFTEMTRLAAEHGAVNLAQGFPDFDGPEAVRQAAAEAIRAGHNQYARMFGVPSLNEAIAADWHARTGLTLDPHAEVTVTSGCTEALAAAFLGLVNPGDEVILFEPFYDSYRAGVAMAGGVCRYVPLRPPAGRPGWDAATESHAFQFDPDELRRAFTPRTRAIVVNTPHNPTGKVFTRAELALIADLCVEHDAAAITDEVYEHLLYEIDLPHLHLATFPGMAERTLTLSSLGKSMSLTGWKIGWAIGAPPLTRAVRAAHQFLTFATATPLQHAAAEAIRQGAALVRPLVADLRAARDRLGRALSELGLTVYRPAGTYFMMTDHTPLGLAADDRVFCRELTIRAGVTAIPPSAFYDDPARGKSLVRWAFCKKPATIDEAIRRLAKVRAMTPGAAHGGVR